MLELSLYVFLFYNLKKPLMQNCPGFSGHIYVISGKLNGMNVLTKIVTNKDRGFSFKLDMIKWYVQDAILVITDLHIWVFFFVEVT